MYGQAGQGADTWPSSGHLAMAQVASLQCASIVVSALGNMKPMSTYAIVTANCRWSLPGIWAYAAFITANNYLQAQRIVRPQVVTSAVVLAIHPPLNWLCIYTLGMLPLSRYILDTWWAVKSTGLLHLHKFEFTSLSTAVCWHRIRVCRLWLCICISHLQSSLPWKLCNK